MRQSDAQFSARSPPPKVPSSSAHSSGSIYLGDFSELLVGIRSELRTVVLRERYRGDNLPVGFMSFFGRDVQLAHPASFCKVVGITPA